MLRRLGCTLLSIICLIGAIALIRDTAYNGHDFAVFWRAGNFVLQGDSAYSIARDGGMVFKYPPWLIPFFFPIALLPLEIAKWFWGILEVISLALVIHWLVRVQKCNLWRTLAVALAFWGLWVVHAIDGQISLVMLAVSLWAWHEELFEKLDMRSVLISISLSTKIFTVFPLLFRRLTFNRAKTVAKVLSLFILLSLPAWWVAPNRSAVALFSSWSEAAGSGGALLSKEQIRGRSNPGLPGYSLHLLEVPPENYKADVAAFLVATIFIGIAWAFISRELDPKDAWVGWLGLVPVVHPLPWWHLFVFSFPLALLALERAVFVRNRYLLTGALTGIFLIGISTEKALGSFGQFLERNAAKSWGVLICAFVLVLAQRHLIPKAIPKVDLP